MDRVLVIERRANARTSMLFAAEGYVVVTAVEPGEAVEAVDSFNPDIVLLEVALPDFDALETCRLVRTATPAPVVILCDPCSERQALEAFAVGADSVVIEPVGSHELVARARALLRRRPAEAAASSDEIVVGPIRLNRARREIHVHGELVSVPRREFEIAQILLGSAGRTVHRSTIVRELWGAMRDTKSLDVQVGRLRSRFATAGAGQCIVTVRGVGFRALKDDELAPSTRAPDTTIYLSDVEAVEDETAPSALRHDIDLHEGPSAIPPTVSPRRAGSPA